MNRKFLEDLGLEKEAIDKIMAENGKAIEAEKSKATASETKATALEKQLADVQKNLDDIKKQSGNSDELNKKLSDMEVTAKAEKEALEKQLKSVKFNSALDMKLATSKARDEKAVKAIKALLDTEKIEMKDDGTLNGLDEQITSLQKESAYLFDLGKSVEGYNPKTGGTGKAAPSSMAEAIQMTMQQTKS